VDRTIQTATDTPLAFSGSASVTIAQGRSSGRTGRLDLPPLGNLTITGPLRRGPQHVTGHSGSRTTSYIQTAARRQRAEHGLGADDRPLVLHIPHRRDGRGFGPGRRRHRRLHHRRSGHGYQPQQTGGRTSWPRAMQQNPDPADVAVLNQGIGATNLIGNSGTAGQARFDRGRESGRAASATRASYHGVNGIGAAGPSTAACAPPTTTHRARAWRRAADLRRDHLPFRGNSYYSAAHENRPPGGQRHIRSGVFDGVIDFDAPLTDGGNPPALQAVYATWAQTDWLHPDRRATRRGGKPRSLALRGVAARGTRAARRPRRRCPFTRTSGHPLTGRAVPGADW
jgi:hypothetical protein